MIQYKQLYRFYCLRHYALSLNSSGLYHKEIIKEVAQLYHLSYNTLRADLKLFERNGWIALHGKKFRLLNRKHDYYRLFEKNLTDILSGQIDFVGLILKKKFQSYLYAQALREAESMDKRTRAKYLKIVRQWSYIGANKGIYAGVRKVGDIFGKSFVTGFRYLNRMTKAGMKIHRNSLDLGPSNKYWDLRNDETYGRLFVQNGRCFMRLLNAYSF